MVTDRDEQHAAEVVVYAPPTIERLGTLAELTQGGSLVSLDDGFGAAGDAGSAG